jgi:hypothetical protein
MRRRRDERESVDVGGLTVDEVRERAQGGGAVDELAGGLGPRSGDLAHQAAGFARQATVSWLRVGSVSDGPALFQHALTADADERVLAINAEHTPAVRRRDHLESRGVR